MVDNIIEYTTKMQYIKCVLDEYVVNLRSMVVFCNGEINIEWRPLEVTLVNDEILDTSFIDDRDSLKLLASKISAFQGVSVALLMVVTSLFWENYILSVLFGGVCAWVPHVYFSWMVCRYFGVKAPRIVLWSFYVGELGKFILSVLLLVVAFTQIKPFSPLLFFGSYIIVQGMQWLVPVLVREVVGGRNG